MTLAVDYVLPATERVRVAEATPVSTRARLRNRHVAVAGSLLLLLPNALFATALRPLPAAMLLVGVTGGVALARGSRSDAGLLAQPVAATRLAACLFLALVLLVLGGEAHLVFANWDWLWRDAVLADVSRAPFPPVYAVGGEQSFLRAPLGMYMLPALVARVAGLAAGHVALLLQNATFLGLALYLLATLAGRRAHLAVAVFVGFSGLDALGQLIVWLQQGRGPFVLPSHIESWMAGLQYSSTVTQLFWVPNHALPSYWLALLVLLCARGEASLAQLGVAMAAALFWSPFAFIGTLPFAAFLLATTWREALRAPRVWVAAAVALCFLPVALYLRVDAAQVPHSFVLLQPFVALMILLFLAVEIPHAWLIRRRRHDIDPALAKAAAVAVAVLVALPSVRVGLANDLAMRASIPALFILAFAFAEAWAGTWRAHRGLFVGGAAILLVGAITPAQEVRRALLFPAFRASSCDLVTVWKKLDPGQSVLANYLAQPSDLPPALMRASPTAMLRDEPTRTCWPDLAQTSMDRWIDSSDAAIRGMTSGAPRL